MLFGVEGAIVTFKKGSDMRLTAPPREKALLGGIKERSETVLKDQNQGFGNEAIVRVGNRDGSRVLNFACVLFWDEMEKSAVEILRREEALCEGSGGREQHRGHHICKRPICGKGIPSGPGEESLEVRIASRTASKEG